MVHFKCLLVLAVGALIQSSHAAVKYDGTQSATLRGGGIEATQNGRQSGSFDANRQGQGYSGDANRHGYDVSGSRNGPSEATMDGKKNTAMSKSRTDFEAGSYKGEKATVQGASNGNVKALSAGGKTLSGRTASASQGKKAEALNRGDNDIYRTKYDSKNVGVAGSKKNPNNVASAKVGNNNVQAKCKGGRGCGDDVRAQRRGDQTLVQTKSGKKYAAEKQTSGYEQHTSYSVNGKKQYDSSVTKSKNMGTVYNPLGRGQLAEVQMTEEGERPCDSFPDNKNPFSSANKKVDVKDRDIKVKMEGENGQSYKFPSCFFIEVNIWVPAGLALRDMAAMLNCAEANCGSIRCGDGAKCGDFQCVYKDLCGDPNVQSRSLEKDVGEFLAGESSVSDRDCDEVRNQDEKRVLRFKYCPDVDSDYNGERNYCSRDLMSTMSTASLETQVKILKKNVPNERMNCGPKDWTLIACRRAIAKYNMKWFGVGNPGAKFLESGASALRSVNNIGGKGWSAGTADSGNLLGGLLGGGNNGGGGSLGGFFGNRG